MTSQENMSLRSVTTAPADPEERIRTSLGVAYWAESASFMEDLIEEQSVDLIMTSPPFGLVRKKSMETLTPVTTWNGFARLPRSLPVC